MMREAEELIASAVHLTHVRTLTPGSYVKPDDPVRGIVTLVTNGSFTYGSWNEKPQHQRTLTSILADALKVDPELIDLRFAPVRPLSCDPEIKLNSGGRNA